MQKVLERIKNNKTTVISVLGMLLIAVFYNALSPYTADDYSYMLNFSDMSRITNPLQIFPSLWDHYLTVNGRILPHFFVQFFMIFPKWVYNIINAVVFVGLIWVMLNLVERKKFNVLMFLAVPIAFWIYIPAYGQIFLWMTGSANYCWAFLISLLFMKFYIALYQEPEKTLGNKGMVGLSFFGLFFGAYSEIVSFPVIFMCFVIMCLTMINERNIKRYWKYCIPIVTGAAGYLTLVLSPGSVTRKEGFSLGLIFKSFIDVFEEYYRCSRILLIVWAVLLVIAIYFKAGKKSVAISICLCAINMISMAMLSVASYVVARHYAIPIFYLLCAIVVLLQALRGRGQIECVTYCICAYVIATSLWSLWEGTYDIYDVSRRCAEREAYILQQAECGIEEVTVPIITPLTKYSCKYDLIDIREDYSEPWPNAEIAKYYGLKKIYGKRME